MKLQFDSKLEYQNQAISSVVDLFKGQSPMQSLFSVGYYGQIAGQIGMIGTDNGIGNRLELDTEEILENLKEIQLRNGLHQNKTLKRHLRSQNVCEIYVMVNLHVFLMLYSLFTYIL